MKTLDSCCRGKVTLGDDVFVILDDEHPSASYKKGTRVCLISGCDGSTVPGHHFNSEYVTVCREEATTAEFCGIKKTSLRKL